MTDTLDVLVDRAARGVLLHSEGPALRAAVAKLGQHLADEHQTSALRAGIAHDLRVQLRAAEDELARLRPLPAQLAEAQAALATLHEGEELYEDERLVATPGQWIWLWNRDTPQQRLERAERLMGSVERAIDCLPHQMRLAEHHEDRRVALGRALAAEAQVAAVRAVHRRSTLHDVVSGQAAYCVNCRFAWPCPTITAIHGTAAPAAVKAMPLMAVSREDQGDWARVGLPQQGAVPTLAAMAELAAGARAEHDAEQQHLEASIRVTAWVAKLTVRRTEPVEQIAGAPEALDRLTAAIAELASGTAPTRSAGLVDWLTSAPGMPLIPDEALPPGEIHLRPHPRPADSPSSSH